MLYELKVDEFNKVKPLFSKLNNRTAIFSVIEGNTKGKIFVDNAANPRCAFFWNDFRYSYLSADPLNKIFQNDLFILLSETLIPEAKISHDPTLVIYPCQTEWNKILKEALSNYKIKYLTRKIYRFTRIVDKSVYKIPKNYQLRKINSRLLGEIKKGVPDIIDMFYTSRETFLSKGLGFAIIDTLHNKIISSCLSVFFGNNMAEIDISTDKEFRQQGFATIVAKAFLTECNKRNIEPIWECWSKNKSSILIAESIGFQNIENYPVLFLDLKN